MILEVDELALSSCISHHKDHYRASILRRTAPGSTLRLVCSRMRGRGSALCSLVDTRDSQLIRSLDTDIDLE